MLNENIRNLRKSKGLSQEDLAVKLNVVRQTISKWEKGLSVPDSEMLIRIAEELDTSVNTLLGEPVPEDEENELKTIAAKLEFLNEQFAKRNEKRRKTIRIILFVVLGITVGSLLYELFMYIFFHASTVHVTGDVSYVGGVEGPASVAITNGPLNVTALIIAIVVAAISIIGIYLTKKK